MDAQTANGRIAALMRMEEAATDAYDAAIGKLKGSKSESSLQRFREDHDQHASTLKELVAKSGDQPAAPGSLQEFRDTLVDAVAQAHDYYGVFSAMRVAEAAIKLQYDEAMQTDIAADARNPIREFSRDEDEHMDYLQVATHGIGLS